ncbi:MAG: hypothetical protein WCO29_02260 [Nostocales cyanobacterium ELA583]|jgi:hypothetical protein
MANIQISGLLPIGYDLFNDDASFLNELATEELQNFGAGHYSGFSGGFSSSFSGSFSSDFSSDFSGSGSVSGSGFWC